MDVEGVADDTRRPGLLSLPKGALKEYAFHLQIYCGVFLYCGVSQLAILTLWNGVVIRNLSPCDEKLSATM